MRETILVLDFGSKYTQLIARRIREIGVYSAIVPYNIDIKKIKELAPRGIVLSGSPYSAHTDGAPLVSTELFDLGIPMIGICYGIQLMAMLFGGEIGPSKIDGDSKSNVTVDSPYKLFTGCSKDLEVWMSHSDQVTKVPEGFEAIASAPDVPIAAIRHSKKEVYGLQFHPEVALTDGGKKVLMNFALNICGCKGSWATKSFIEEEIEHIRELVGDKRVLCGLSGGVDSAVTAAIIQRAIGSQLTCMFVDTGLMRLNEGEKVERVFSEQFKTNLVHVDAEARFIEALKGVTDPEKKRKIIGELFVRVFEEESAKIGKFDFLAQGTLYPDVIESQSPLKERKAVKSHHNVGGLPKDIKFKLIEPLRELFKDEVRKVGAELGLSEDIVYRHPFPGPGLAVRILGEVTKEKCDTLRKADRIAIDEMKKHGVYHNVWQAFCVLLPIQTVGVSGEERTYENAAVLRAVNSSDGMSAEWAKLPYEVLESISRRVISEVKGINRMVYDISSKPPATIEWE
jgi:GMP synthase (glutamine-hydrolysing)